MKRYQILSFVIFFTTMLSPPAGFGQTPADNGLTSYRHLISSRVDNAPEIDGVAGDQAWLKSIPLQTVDPVADITITLQSVHTDTGIYILVSFPDPSENREHKTLIWRPDLKSYVIGPKREDSFVIKWNMMPYPVDLTLSGNEPYEADIWYWKSHRTDHAGFADDKHQTLSLKELNHSKKMISKMGRRLYLVRHGDDGKSAYRINIPKQFTKQKIPLYRFQNPDGGRADVKAKGKWSQGVWTIEFGRKLKTLDKGDLQFDKKRAYLFGVSRYEIAGRRIDPDLEEPKFGAGEITEHLFLKIE